MATGGPTVLTDLTVRVVGTVTPPSTAEPSHSWRRIEKALYLDSSHQRGWLYVAVAKWKQLADSDLVITDIRIGERPGDVDAGPEWESRPAGIWLQRNPIEDDVCRAVTDIDVLFGSDAVDPRPRWTLTQSPLRLDADPTVPSARLTFLRGKAIGRPVGPDVLRFDGNGRFKILQISDTHMVTGVGVCDDAIDPDGNDLPDCDADPLTVQFMKQVLYLERPDLVVLAGDQLHHDILDSQSALFKAVAPMIERSIPFAAVFGNHDSEGSRALSRTAQMSILQSLPHSLCKPGPEHVDGVGNFHIEIFEPEPSEKSLATLYFLDSHGQIPSKVHNPDYAAIQKSQIDWFTSNSQRIRNTRGSDKGSSGHDLSLVFQHIPLPEFGDPNLIIRSGHRREPTEGPRVNSHFYDALLSEGVSTLACAHDHLNDFCALLPQQPAEDHGKARLRGPWLCYGGGSGFQGYCSYGSNRYHRRMRVWELDSRTQSLRTWMRVEYAAERTEELLLVRHGEIVQE
ncbi:Phosphatase DCR2 [Cyphellophora attinorum]|uniref:Phosphatase DCR2 n=1 Tax=Cyphellophora attinorum TaxID=1664694 RepID=A0A0N1HI25_9EURO|nr:Phosphatase DCR2 [Phialophora attinorum]KPI35614.1 Phosphatase DCR2 [Phialophora attinorum]